MNKQNNWNDKLKYIMNKENNYIKYYNNLKNENKPFSKCLIIYLGGIIRNKDEFEDKQSINKYINNDIKTNQSLCNIQKTYLSNNGFYCLVLNDYNKIIYYKIKYIKEFINNEINSDLWKKIAEIIHKKYSTYDGFVIVHSLDYWEYSASALSYMCQNLSKPIIFTSSIYKDKGTHHEYYENLKNSITIASLFKIPEVCVFYNERLLRANRTIRVNSDGIIPFDSPNYPYLGYYNVLFEPNWNYVNRIPNEEDHFFINTNYEKNIQVLTLNPFVNYSNFNYIIENKPKALVIESYGMGNFPTDNEGLNKILKNLKENNVLTISITQCRKGFIDTLYETSDNEFGIIKANDMILSSILTKLGHLFGNYTNIEDIKYLITKNLIGEITEKDVQINHNSRLIENTTKHLKISFKNKIVIYNSMIFKSILFKAIMSNNKDLFVDVLSYDSRKNIDINELRDYYGRNVLHYFSYNPDLELVKYFVNMKIIKLEELINKEDYDGVDPMLFALIRKNIDLLYFFKQNNCKINLNIKVLKRLLIEALRNNDINFVKLLYFCGFNEFNKVINKQGRNVLFYSVIYNKKEIFDFLVTTVKMDLDLVDKEGNKLQDFIDFDSLISKKKFDKHMLLNKQK